MRRWVRISSGVFATVLVAAGVVGLTSLFNPPAAATANVWVNTSAGGTPTRSASLVAYDANNAYGTLAAACSASQANDVIRVQSGTYTGASTLTGCGSTVTAACVGTVSSNPCVLTSSGTTTTIHTSGITLDGFTFATTATNSTAKAVAITTTSATPTSNVTIENSLIYTLTAGNVGCAPCTTAVLFISGTSGVTIGPNTQILACCATDGVDIYRDGANGVGNANFTFTGSTLLGDYDTCTLVHASMIPNQPSCTGYGIGDGCSSVNCEHDDGFAVSDCQTCSWLNSKINEGGAQPIFWQEFNAGVISSNSMIGDLIVGKGAPASGGAGVNIGTFGSGAVTNYAGTFNWLYDTLVGVNLKVYTTDGGIDRWAVSSTINLTGILSEGDNAAYGGSGGFHFPGFNTVNNLGNNTGCANNGSNLTLNYLDDWFYDVGPCTGTGNVNIRSVPKAVVFGSFTYPFDLHLAAGANPPVDAAEATCASASPDLDADVRPKGAACDIGGDER